MPTDCNRTIGCCCTIRAYCSVKIDYNYTSH